MQWGRDALGEIVPVPLDRPKQVHGYVSQDGKQLFGWTVCPGGMAESCPVDLTRTPPVMECGSFCVSELDAQHDAAAAYVDSVRAE